MREAARSLVVSQPAVSAALASLQAELGVRLVERDGRGLRLTEAGTVLAGYGRRILGMWQEAAVAAASAAAPERGRLRLAAVTTAGEHVLPQLLASFRERYPEAEVVLEVANRTCLWSLLHEGGADLGIGGRPPVGGRLVSLASSGNDLVVVAAPQGSPLQGAPRAVGVEELGGQTWLLREPGSGTRSTAEELFEQLGMQPRVLTVGSNGALRESAIAGLGVALVSRAAVARQLASGELQEWRAGPLPLRRRWHLLCRSPGPLPATAALFRDCLLERETGWAV